MLADVRVTSRDVVDFRLICVVSVSSRFCLLPSSIPLFGWTPVGLLTLLSVPPGVTLGFSCHFLQNSVVDICFHPGGRLPGHRETISHAYRSVGGLGLFPALGKMWCCQSFFILASLVPGQWHLTPSVLWWNCTSC